MLRATGADRADFARVALTDWAALMKKDDIQLLFEYDRWANNRVLDAASSLSSEQFTHDLRGSFCSVRDTLVHIIGGEWGWLTYWKEACPSSALGGSASLPSGFLADLWDRHDALFRPREFPDVAAIRLKWTEVEEEQTEFVSALTEEALERMLPVRRTQLSLANLMQHLVNHSTYHRGQVAVMMRQLGANCVPTDFHLFLLGCPRVV
jgi:uncharacterized damage-inducible protein DinB